MNSCTGLALWLPRNINNLAKYMPEPLTPASSGTAPADVE